MSLDVFSGSEKKKKKKKNLLAKTSVKCNRH